MSKRDRELELRIQTNDDLTQEMDLLDQEEPCKVTPLGQKRARRQPIDSFHKVNVKKTREHVYNFVNGEQYVVIAGEDGVTQEMIDELNRAHNRQVDQNCKICLMPKAKEEGPMKPFRAKRKAVLSLNGFIESMNGLADHLPCFADPKTLNGVEGELGLCESPLVDALMEAIDSLPLVEKRAIQLVHLEGYSITQAAKLEGCRNESTLRMRLKRGMEKLRGNKPLEALYRKG